MNKRDWMFIVALAIVVALYGQQLSTQQSHERRIDALESRDVGLRYQIDQADKRFDQTITACRKWLNDKAAGFPGIDKDHLGGVILLMEDNCKAEKLVWRISGSWYDQR